MSNFESWQAVEIREEITQDQLDFYQLRRDLIYTVGNVPDDETLTFLGEETVYPQRLFKPLGAENSNIVKGKSPEDVSDFDDDSVEDMLGWEEEIEEGEEVEDEDSEEDDDIRLNHDDLMEEHASQYEQGEDEENNIPQSQESAELKPPAPKKSKGSSSGITKIEKPEEEKAEDDSVGLDYSKIMEDFSTEDLPPINRFSAFRVLMFNAEDEEILPDVYDVIPESNIGKINISGAVIHLYTGDRIIYLPYIDKAVGVLQIPDPVIEGFEREAMLNALLYSHYKTQKFNYSLISVFRDYTRFLLGGNYLQNTVYLQEILFNKSNRKFNEQMEKMEKDIYPIQPID